VTLFTLSPFLPFVLSPPRAKAFCVINSPPHQQKNRQTEGFSLAVAVSLMDFSRQATIPTRLCVWAAAAENVCLDSEFNINEI
jgi:hypothetical protein